MRIFVLLVALLVGAGSAVAGFNEGLAAYFFGDYKEALREFRPLAEQGNSAAQNMLGAMCNEGQGTPQDFPRAVKWFHKAAEQGNANAQYNLAGMYAKGEGVKRDYPTAYMWLALAAAQDSKHAKARDFIVGNITREQIAEGQRLTREWLKKH